MILGCIQHTTKIFHLISLNEYFARINPNLRKFPEFLYINKCDFGLKTKHVRYIEIVDAVRIVYNME